MNPIRFYVFSLCSCMALALAGCSNPADNVPQAQVGDAAQAVSSEPVAGKVYKLSPDSTITYIGSKVTGSHDGGFKKFNGEFTVPDGKAEGSQGRVVIDLDSIWSDNDRLTNHLKSTDFFEVEKYPTSTFTLSQIEKTSDGYTVNGELDLHGVKKNISFPAQIEVNEQQVTLTSEFFIKRFDFKITYPGKANDLIRDEVVIKLKIIAHPVQITT